MTGRSRRGHTAAEAVRATGTPAAHGRLLGPRSPGELVDDALLRLRRAPLIPLALSMATSVPLTTGVLVLFQLTGPHLPASLAASRTALIQGLCLALALLLPLRHLAAELAVRASYPEERPPPFRLLPSLSTGALCGLAQSLGLLFLLAPGLLIGAVLSLVPAVSALEGHYGERALRRGFELGSGVGPRAVAFLGLAVALFGCVALNLYLGLPWLIDLVELLSGVTFTELRETLRLDRLDHLMVLAAASWVVLDPLVPLACAEIALDVRVRQEGLDIERQLDGLEGPA